MSEYRQNLYMPPWGSYVYKGTNIADDSTCDRVGGMVPIFIGAWHMFWRGFTTAPPLVSTNWAGVIFGAVVFAVTEANSIRRHGWRQPGKLRELGWSVLIGAGAWIGLSAANSIYLVSEDHRIRVAENQQLRSRISQLENINTKLAAPRPGVKSPPLPPPDPSLMRVGAVLRMMGDLRATFRKRRSPIAFLVTSPTETDWLKGDLDAMLLNSCDSPQGRLCTVEEVGGLTLPPPKQGITIHIHEPQPESEPSSPAAQTPFTTIFPPALSNWFFVQQGGEIAATISEKLPGRFRDTTFVWIEVGPGSPWKGAAYLKDGVGRAQIDEIKGTIIPLNQQLKDAAESAGKIQAQLRDPRTMGQNELARGVRPDILPNAVLNFRGASLLEVIITIRNARIAGVDRDQTVTAEGLANGTRFQDFGSLKQLLIKFSEDEAVKSK